MYLPGNVCCTLSGAERAHSMLSISRGDCWGAGGPGRGAALGLNVGRGTLGKAPIMEHLHRGARQNCLQLPICSCQHNPVYLNSR